MEKQIETLNQLVVGKKYNVIFPNGTRVNNIEFGGFYGDPLGTCLTFGNPLNNPPCLCINEYAYDFLKKYKCYERD